MVSYINIYTKFQKYIDNEQKNLYEHQSSFNPNMPVRFLIYLGQEFQKIIEVRNGDIYGAKLITLPTPRCVVFYNGSTEEPEERILRLSDAFEQKEENPQVELTVRMIIVLKRRF